MRIRYTYTVLKYIHDPVTGEFANIGILLWARDVQKIVFKATQSYGRLSEFFPGMDGDHFRRMMRSLQARFKDITKGTSGLFPDSILVKGATELGNRILPTDDSSLVFSGDGAGVAKDLDATAEEIYERYIDRYTKKPSSQRRPDAAVLGSIKPLLTLRHLDMATEPVVIKAKDYSHTFPIAWRNGRLNTCEAVSFDFTEPASVVEKANTWLGRGVSLKESPEDFKLHLLVGKPRDANLGESFQKALNILDKMPLEHAIVMEEDASALVTNIERDLKH